MRSTRTHRTLVPAGGAVHEPTRARSDGTGERGRRLLESRGYMFPIALRHASWPRGPAPARQLKKKKTHGGIGMLLFSHGRKAWPRLEPDIPTRHPYTFPLREPRTAPCFQGGHPPHDFSLPVSVGAVRSICTIFSIHRRNLICDELRQALPPRSPKGLV